MSRRHEREIVRRLAERGDVDPPTDLLGRIQAEIPDAVKVGREVANAGRETGRRPPARQLWLLAASLVAMVGAGLFSLRLFEGDRELGSPRLATAPMESAREGPLPPPTTQAPPSTPRRVYPQEAPAADAAPPALHKLRRAPEVAAPRAEAEKPGGPGGVVGGVAGGVVGGVAGGTLGTSPQSPAPAPAEPPAAEANAPQPVQPLTATAQPILADTPAPETSASQMEAKAAPSELAEGGAPAAPRAKTTAKTEGRRASQPARGFVDAAAMPRDAFRLQGGSTGFDAREDRGENLAQAPLLDRSPGAEGAPSPFAGGERRRLVLFHLSGAPEVEVTFDPAAVARYRRLSAGPVVLYEVELQPAPPAGAPVASLRGGPRLWVADLAPSWEQASPGFRLASLSAELAGISSGARPRSDLPELLRRARALAAERPGDLEAAELVHRIERIERLSP